MESLPRPMVFNLWRPPSYKVESSFDKRRRSSITPKITKKTLNELKGRHSVVGLETKQGHVLDLLVDKLMSKERGFMMGKIVLMDQV